MLIQAGTSAAATSTPNGAGESAGSQQRGEAELKELLARETGKGLEGQGASRMSSDEHALMRISCATDPTNDAALREKETALVDLGKLYRDQKYVGLMCTVADNAG